MADKSELDSPLATRVPVRQPFPFGDDLKPRKDDPAWAPPSDPMANVDAARRHALEIPRQIPLSVIQTRFTVGDVGAALDNFVAGNFSQASDLVDAIMGDDRVQATLGSRVGGLLGRPMKFTRAEHPDTAAAEKCLDAWKSAWSTIAPEPALAQSARSDVMAGFSVSQLVWNTDGDTWIPTLVPWHLRYTWYLPQLFSYFATTQDGVARIDPGDGIWVLHTPHGPHRGWLHGCVRAVAQPWLIRNFAYRDWARYSERHGMPIILAKEPAGGDPELRQQFAMQLATLGQETVLRLPQGTEQQFSYDVSVLEAQDNAWQAFPGLIDRCDMSIVLAILWQNLTTEVSEGSFAAARVHAGVKQSALAADNRARAHTIYRQIARPFAAFNFGDPNLAPWTEWDVEPVEDRESSTKVMTEFGTALKMLRDAGFQLTDPEQVKDLAWRISGLRLGAVDLKSVPPPSAVAPARAPGAAPVAPVSPK